MCIFQSEQLIKLINASFHWKKTNGHRIRYLVQNPLDYNEWDARLGRCQKFTPKLCNSAKLKTVLLSMSNDLPQEFIDRAILSFQKRLDFCVLLQRVDTLNSLNTERAADIHHWNV